MASNRPVSRNGRRTLPVAAAVLLSLLLTLLAGCGSATTSESPAASSPAAPVVYSLPHSLPKEVDIPKINAKSSLVQLGLNDDKTVQVPPVSRPQQAGWYQNSPTPGEVGPSVILGHVDGNKQEGIFFHLHELTKGDEVDVTRDDGKIAKFIVDHVDTVQKSGFSTDAVYGNTPDAELRLITCGGTFDQASHNYLSNVIAYAHLVQS